SRWTCSPGRIIQKSCACCPDHKDIEGGMATANLIVICGPQAVGKMTVAESLRDKLKYNMMMNHDSIEVSDRIFGFATPAQREFNMFFREKAFELAVKHDVDLIFTYVCAFDSPQEREYLTRLADLFTSNQGGFYFVELSASLETRLERKENPSIQPPGLYGRISMFCWAG
ncbi:MAG: AAA family ATPase, partial [Oscillospiraceae bacterium]|nr:AAA family ATPase [Oscillospiraceae bacterium]